MLYSDWSIKQHQGALTRRDGGVFVACHAIQIGIIIFFVLFTWTPVKIPSKEMSRNIFLAVETCVGYNVSLHSPR